MPGVSGIELLRKARALQPQKTLRPDHRLATVETAVEALREGASDYIVKRSSSTSSGCGVRRLLEHQVASSGIALFRGPWRAPSRQESLGESPAMHAVRTQVARTGPA